VPLYGQGVITVDKRTVSAFLALSACLRAHDYRTRRADTGAYNCRRITGGSGYSLHAYGIAADLNWSTNPYGKRLVTDMPPAMRDAIKAIRTRGGHLVFRWGGDYSGNKDAMHFEVVASPAELATGIDPNTVPGARITEPPEVEDPNFGRPWQQFAAGATDAAIYRKGGRNDEVAELQILLKHTVTGSYRYDDVQAVIALKKAAGNPPEFGVGSLVNRALIDALRGLAGTR